MGCDVHFRVEYYGPIETVVRNDKGEIVVAPDGDHAWLPAEPLTPNQSLARLIQARKNGEYPQWSDENWDEVLSEEAEFVIAYEDRFYTGRNYPLFAKLSGVRGDDFETVVGDGHPNYLTLPGDCSPEVEAELSLDDLDLHSHGWATLTELLAVDWTDLIDAGKEHNYNYFQDFKATLTDMEALALEKCGGNTDHVRAIWAYDN